MDATTTERIAAALESIAADINVFRGQETPESVEQFDEWLGSLDLDKLDEDTRADRSLSRTDPAAAVVTMLRRYLRDQ